MEAFGGGSWSRYRARRTVEETLSIDAGRWRRDGAIAPGERRAGIVRWYRNDECIASMRFETDCGSTAGTARLMYRHSSGRDAARDVDERVPLTSIPSNLGVGRIWHFACPAVGCGRRAKKLYLGGRSFACRRCSNLTYESCTTSHDYERMAWMLARELGGNPRELAGVLRDWSKEARDMARALRARRRQ